MSSLNASLARFGNPRWGQSFVPSPSDENHVVPSHGHSGYGRPIQPRIVESQPKPPPRAPNAGTYMPDVHGRCGHWENSMAARSHRSFGMSSHSFAAGPQVSQPPPYKAATGSAFEQMYPWEANKPYDEQVAMFDPNSRMAYSAKGQSSWMGNTRHVQSSQSSDFRYATQDSVSDDEEEASVPVTAPPQGVPMTTLMVRNLPPRLRQEELLQAWPPGLNNFNLLYVPYNVKQRCTSRYAFMNFVTQDSAMRFFNTWHGRFFELSSRPNNAPNAKPIEVRVSVRQGMEANMRHWQATLRKNCSPRLLPAVFIGGRRQDFWSYANLMQDPEMVQAGESRVALDMISL